MKQLIKRTCKPKSKKTIRTMTPLARKMAHLTQATKSIERRLAYLTEEIYQLERSENAAQAQIKGHALVCPLAHERAPTKHDWPELPNGEGVVAPPGCEVDGPGDGLPITESEVLQLGGEGAGYHEGSDADPRD